MRPLFPPCTLKFAFLQVSVPSVGAGSTQFADLNMVVTALTPQEKMQWNSIYLRNLGNGVVHPLMYKHPLTGKEVLCLGLGSWEGLGNHVKAYSRDFGGNDLLSKVSCRQRE